jgi:hypothetical protein
MTTMVAADGSLNAVLYDGRLVALAGRRRCHILAEDLDERTLRFVAAMCLFNREVEAGRVPGAFTSERAARWARRLLIPPEDLSAGSDAQLAKELAVPVEQVMLARRDMAAA